jgi:hypothetical protein
VDVVSAVVEPTVVADAVVVGAATLPSQPASSAVASAAKPARRRADS